MDPATMTAEYVKQQTEIRRHVVGAGVTVIGAGWVNGEAAIIIEPCEHKKKVGMPMTGMGGNGRAIGEGSTILTIRSEKGLKVLENAIREARKQLKKQFVSTFNVLISEMKDAGTMQWKCEMATNEPKPEDDTLMAGGIKEVPPGTHAVDMDFRAEAILKAKALIAVERERQVTEEGWTPEHDDEHMGGEMLRAAVIYFQHAAHKDFPLAMNADGSPMGWPWEAKWWKPKTPEQDLIRAGALCVAERDRIKRKSPKSYVGHIDFRLTLITEALAELFYKEPTT